MSSHVQSHEFEFNPDRTCKQKWIVRTEATEAGPRVIDIEIAASLKPDGKEMGCKGHPRTIVALTRGRLVREIDVDALANAACTRPCSCGQALGQCLSQIR
ncbi:MAG: hypothetical protein BIFFINMI_02428 [Phycisphaerae bacterium]|nr:hypothetical protein [Phycisphaerae bacterium]